MGSQSDYPPPPHPSILPSGPSTVHDVVYSPWRRALAAHPPNITTDLVRPSGGQSHISTPVTAIPSYNPATPVAIHPRPVSTLGLPAAQTTSQRSPTMEPYDPSRWSRGGQVSGSQMVFRQRTSGYPRDATNTSGLEGLTNGRLDIEVMPSPPPPYSPNRKPDITSPLLGTIGFSASPVSIPASSQTSPPGVLSPSFPPPPGQSQPRERSASGQRTIFGFSGFRGKPSPVHDSGDEASIPTASVPHNRPPAARRAASTGQIHTPTVEEPSSAVSSASQNEWYEQDQGWQPGMPLPGPPSCPPPIAGRSQSLGRITTSTSRASSQTSEPGIDVPQHAAPRRTLIASTLGPVPPTPADWVDPDVVDQEPASSMVNGASDPLCQPLRIDTGSKRDSALFRRPARRDGSSQGLRERRSRSRAAKEGHPMVAPPADAEADRFDTALSSPNEGMISRRREHMRKMSGPVGRASVESQTLASHSRHGSQPVGQSASAVLTPPYTPAINQAGGTSTNMKASGGAGSDRPISHLLHQPLPEFASIPAPLTPQRPNSASLVATGSKLDTFSTQALQRHQIFIEKELEAGSDKERLELFTNFIVHESRLRRDRYSAAYNAMAGEIMDLTRDMWRSFTQQGKRATTPSTSLSSFDPTAPSWASDGLPTSAVGNVPSSASSFEDFPPATEAGPLRNAAETFERSESRQWGEAFKPSLSPIPSMAVSTVPDEDSSRGRTASRWWEQSNSGSGSVGRPERLEKTLRETKYMGIRPESFQEEGQPSPESSRHAGSTPGPSSASLIYSNSGYPPEKVGLHEDTDFNTPLATPLYALKPKVITPGAHSLDVSRLVTLPPPFPRHHPAVNNSHPVMSELRNKHRLLSDCTKIQDIKSAYFGEDILIRRQQDEAAGERRQTMRSHVRARVADGSISFADAANVETEFDEEEAERGKASARSNFDLFESSVAHPLNQMLTDRLEKVNECIDQLRSELACRNENPDHNQTQEEGDEQPERLERLTLLKWLFETREQLHKEIFDLHAERSAKYSEVILTPYRVARLQSKIDEASGFFKKDSHDRQTTYAREAVKRFEELRHIMELNVSRGVEDQLCAFWDIAPGLLEVVQSVPATPHQLASLELQISSREYEENPAYYQHPLQYLFGLLGHAEKSAYQLIEAQTNLLCLLHEVRTATTNAGLRLLEIERSALEPAAEREGSLKAELRHARVVQEEQLTEDLKDKVGEVERQWEEALGVEMQRCKHRVREYLEETGGWEDGLEG